MVLLLWLCLIATFSARSYALRYDASQVEHNVNTNKSATNPIDYWGEWQNHTFTPSPSNWRIPFYTIMLDRFANGNPNNDNANGTQFEHDLSQTQLRHGGDIKGFQDSLDYIQGMGIKALYLAGSPFINAAYAADGYSPLDHTLLDYHMGTIHEWQSAIAEVHRRGMYIILDNTMSTMGDLIGFENYLNTSTPFNRKEHNAVWKSDRRYHDFAPGNDELPLCDYPRFYDDNGLQVNNLSSKLTGCRDSEFDQYGDVAAFGDYPEWQRQISKFAFVQDRLREWRPSVLAKIEHFACMTIATLDIDGFRIDKGLTITVDAQAQWSQSVRQCAKRFGKENFFISGEVVGGNTFGSVYIGRGRTPDSYLTNTTEAITMNSSSSSKNSVRDEGLSALDGVAFHYTVYRGLLRFLGLDGTYAAAGDPTGVNFAYFWETFLKTNDMINANDGVTFDPRHMYGVTNQDVFRWPTIKNGTQKQMLGYFIVALVLPGIPILAWGEEQAFYVMESTNGNYVFGRSPMTSAQAWEMHGCYNPSIGNVDYYDWPIDSGLHGCQDDSISLDHRDPSHPVRNFIKSTHEMRVNYPVFQDGFSLTLLSNQTHDVFFPGSNDTPTPFGLWSMERTGFRAIQTDLAQIAWLVYTNEDHPTENLFNCTDEEDALIAPFSAGSRVKNIYYPYDEYTMEHVGPKTDDRWNESNGCLSSLHLPAYGFKAFVLDVDYITPSPVITKFVPGHDARLLSVSSIPIEIHFSVPMNCKQVLHALIIQSITSPDQTPRIDPASVQCRNQSSFSSDGISPLFETMVDTAWSFAATLINVSDGIHQISVKNVSTAANPNLTTGSIDHLLIRVGQIDNPMVFPSSNYSSSLLLKNANNSLYISHKAAGAERFRYSLNFGTTYSDWQEYPKGLKPSSQLAPKVWSGTERQDWEGEHVIVQYWNGLVASSDHEQVGDFDAGSLERHFPHVFVEGAFNQYGFDSGIFNQMRIEANNTWHFNFIQEWPSQVSLNIWGMNPDGELDQTRVYGDIDGDHILDRVAPVTLVKNVINITHSPETPFLGWEISFNDASYRYHLVPIGSRQIQFAVYILLWLVPIITGAAAIRTFIKSYYGVKHNEVGVMSKSGFSVGSLVRLFRPEDVQRHEKTVPEPDNEGPGPRPQFATPKRLTVLIATMEYDIEDWGIKVKIGGLGVMSSLMGKNLKHQNLIWVIPCIGDVKYPIDRPAESIAIKVLGSMYEIKVQHHIVENITYVLLDAPVFRQQTKADPYPARMDDLDSAIYYSAWNSCIAEIMRRFPIDLYHINDYHGAVAPLYLLPKIVPCLLSLHNAEFQGLWPMRSKVENQEVCDVYNLDIAVVRKYIRFGEVFNLLHAGASYLRIHQKGFGAVGVSTEYGKRAFARYPIFWGMKEIGGLPNPDPTDIASWYGEQIKTEEITVDEELEASKPDLKRQAQEWAGLKQDPHAELFVFVGRWSTQKGVDAIADVFPSIMEKHSRVQLICVGPVIDLYGKFAALKLDRMMEIYKGRVFSQPKFTALPPYIFSGADFALMPSRDEPFGLVAVEFGRKGVLCVGANVGGLGNMPGWWFTIESTTSRHFLHQFRTAIEGALSAKTGVRAIMRARAIKQRFPVRQWVEDLEKLQASAIRISHSQAAKEKRPTLVTPSTPVIVDNSDPVRTLKSRVSKPRLRPRPELSHQNSQVGDLSVTAERALLSGPNLGLGSKMGPSSRRKRPAPPPSFSSNSMPSVPTLSSLRKEGGTVGEPKRSLDLLPKRLPPSVPSIRKIHMPTLSSLDPARLGREGLKNRPNSKQQRPQLLTPSNSSPAVPTLDSLATPGPGIGDPNKAPSNRRKRPPPPLSSNSTPGVPTLNSMARAEDGIGKSDKGFPTQSAMRVPLALDVLTEEDQRGSQAPSEIEPMRLKRFPSMPHVRPHDQKAVKVLGVQLPAERVKALTEPKRSGYHSDDSSTQPSSSSSNTNSPLSPITDFSESQPSSPEPAKKRFSLKASPKSPLSTYCVGQDSQEVDVGTCNPSESQPQTPIVAKKRFSLRLSLMSPLSTQLAGKDTKGVGIGSAKPELASSVRTPKSKVMRSAPAIDHFPSWGPHYFPYGSVTALSTSEVKEEKPDNVLQNVTPFFSDPQGEYENEFQQRLKKLNGKTSEHQLCIEEYLLSSEKSWFKDMRAAELRKNPHRILEEKPPQTRVQATSNNAKDDDFGLGNNYKPPSGLKRLMRKRIGDWPVYSFLLAFGQMIAANSYQITLLSGTVGETASQLYIIASIYLIASLGWWLLFRRLQTVHVVSLPFVFYGIAFLLLGLAAFAPTSHGRTWVQRVATGLYSLASSSGALFFAVNFGDEGGTAVTSFVYRACVIQGSQQIYVVALWYWGEALARAAGTTSIVANLSSNPKVIAPICISIACLMWAVGTVLFLGLPKYYHQKPGNIPSFYTAILRRHIVLWFFIAVVIQNYWLSAPYGRNWRYLWSNQSVPAWQIVLLILTFFVGIWIIILYIFSDLSKSHSWAVPVFAMGLGAPRWAQILWSTSDMGAYLPWTAGPIASGLASRSLWLWLGVLDAVQGVGFGMILLQTLTRFHVLFTLIAAQVLGAAATMLARATAPDRIGPASVFPNLCVNASDGLREPWFWVALLMQLMVPIGFGVFFRKEQLSKA